MPVVAPTIALLTLSNLFMTFAALCLLGAAYFVFRSPVTP